MKKTEVLAFRIREVYLKGTWIANTNFKEQLTDVTLDIANHKIKSLNTIGELTFHINYYLDGILQFLNSGKLEIKDSFSFDMPILKSNHDWEKLRSSLIQNAENLAQHIAALPDSCLNNVFAHETYGTYQRNIEGLIEHSYYHLGQIVLIKKLINT